MWKYMFVIAFQSSGARDVWILDSWNFLVNRVLILRPFTMLAEFILLCVLAGAIGTLVYWFCYAESPKVPTRRYSHRDTNGSDSKKTKKKKNNQNKLKKNIFQSTKNKPKKIKHTQRHPNLVQYCAGHVILVYINHSFQYFSLYLLRVDLSCNLFLSFLIHSVSINCYFKVACLAFIRYFSTCRWNFTDLLETKMFD